MHLAMISEHASPLASLGGEDSGGQNVYVAELARRLGEMGHQVDVFTRRDSEMLPAVVPFAEGVRVVNLPAGPARSVSKDELFPFMYEFRDAFYRFAREEAAAYDLVHANFWMSGWVACEAKRDLGLPFAQTFHALGEIKRREQGDADTSPLERRAVEGRILDEVDLVLATCPAEVEELITLYGADPSRLTVVPCGVDQQTFRPVDRSAAREMLGLSDRPTVVYVGRLVARKGVDTLVEAFALLPRHLDARLVIVGGEPGGSPEAARLAALADTLGVSERVSFAGSRPQEDLRHYYGAADVAVSVPHYEPFGMTPLEAMACATPVVGARVGGIKTSVADGETGYLVPPKGPEALAERVLRLLSDPALRLRLGRAARCRIEECYTWEHVAALAAAAFSEVAVSHAYRTA
ncbi:MAG: Glycosyl transferase, group 1 [uncultured Rubrobacteraceae bacterium]|uniref:Glycosyl transferase, group 1 n=1 Tax=uncultured Rubrobacteraceae bacterium TaxID=349277 RepID=A0A6J4QQY9_9ACTN|nr:MAG: Glycosyl transferase, group 1 [uncultured Rubrobacteraceae bacterium]